MERAEPLPLHAARRGEEVIQSDHGQRQRGDAMDEGPLVKERIDAGLRFVHEFNKYAPVRVAFWLKKQDGWFWYLHVVSDEITGANFDLAYGEVIRLANEMADPDF